MWFFITTIIEKCVAKPILPRQQISEMPKLESQFPNRGLRATNGAVT